MDGGATKFITEKKCALSNESCVCVNAFGIVRSMLADDLVKVVNLCFFFLFRHKNLSTITKK